MTIKQQLEALKTAITTSMITGLVSAGLDPLDEYVLGGPTDSEVKSLGFYLGVGQEAPDSQQFQPVAQLQLPGTAYSVALDYFVVLVSAIQGLSPTLLSSVSLQNISYTEFPPDEDSTSIFTVYFTYSADRDDCDDWE